MAKSPHLSGRQVAIEGVGVVAGVGRAILPLRQKFPPAAEASGA